MENGTRPAPFVVPGVPNDRHPLAVVIVKFVHTAIFLGELGSILWLVVTGLIGRRDRSVAIAAVAVAAEATVFLLNDRVCPLTPLAERLGATKGSVSDIFLPEAVARTIPVWSTGLLVLAALLHLRSTLDGRGPARPSRASAERGDPAPRGRDQREDP